MLLWEQLHGAVRVRLLYCSLRKKHNKYLIIRPYGMDL